MVLQGSFVLATVMVFTLYVTAEEVDRPPEDPQPLPGLDLNKPVEAPEPPGVVFDPTRNMKTREQIRDEKDMAKQALLTAKILEKLKAELAKLKDPVVTFYAIENNGKDHERDPLRVALHDPANGSFYGWKIVRSWLLKPDAAKDALDYVSAPATYGWKHAACFYPGLAIQWKDAERAVTAVICLQCNWMKFELDGVVEVIPLSENGVIDGFVLYCEQYPELLFDDTGLRGKLLEDVGARFRKRLEAKRAKR